MQSTLKYVYTFAAVAIALLSSIAIFNIFADPMCYYRCPGIDLNRASQNVYYQTAQIIEANPDTEVIILGSSRGETVPPQWVEKATGLKTVNLSKGGAGIMLKVSLLRLALEKKLPLKKVIWIADYFELAGTYTDVKVRQTPVLRDQITAELTESWSFSNYWESLQRLIDHNSVEASIRQLSTNKTEDRFALKGSGDKINEVACEADDYLGNTKTSDLEKEIDISYSTFLKFLLEDLNSHFINVFTAEMKKHSDSNIQFYIVIPPFHPKLMEKVRANHPNVEKNYQEWLKILQNQASKNVTVHSFWNGIPNDNLGPSYWDDGAHPTCKSMILMLNKALQ